MSAQGAWLQIPLNSHFEFRYKKVSQIIIVSPPQEFILHTPDYEAMKCWSGNLGQKATHSLVSISQWPLLLNQIDYTDWCTYIYTRKLSLEFRKKFKKLDKNRKNLAKI